MLLLEVMQYLDANLTVPQIGSSSETNGQGLGMAEPLTIVSEDIDDIPLLLAQPERIGV